MGKGLFFTVFNPHGEQNPVALRVLSELEKLGHTVLRLSSPSEYELLSSRMSPSVALFDFDSPERIWSLVDPREELLAPRWTTLGDTTVRLTQRMVSDVAFFERYVQEIAQIGVARALELRGQRDPGGIYALIEA